MSFCQSYPTPYTFSPSAASFGSSTESSSPGGSSQKVFTSVSHPPLTKGSRINMACTYCRKRKIKCSGEATCTNCMRTKRCCVFEEISDEQNRMNKARKARNKALREAGLKPGSLAASAKMPADALGESAVPDVPLVDNHNRRLSAPRLQGWTPPLNGSTISHSSYPSVLLPMPASQHSLQLLTSPDPWSAFAPRPQSPSFSCSPSSVQSSPSTESPPPTPGLYEVDPFLAAQKQHQRFLSTAQFSKASTFAFAGLLATPATSYSHLYAHEADSQTSSPVYPAQQRPLYPGSASSPSFPFNTVAGPLERRATYPLQQRPDQVTMPACKTFSESKNTGLGIKFPEGYAPHYPELEHTEWSTSWCI
ncbi:Zn(2)-C6 fungal-type DNA-binding domain [Phaffia rhodozyma]|uniref:Zn(2)-C6 fungal-type DNA-binding domain n=1 Tax=Phaffia rhodozyma TaxID=264483 RepID=A0A0F7SK93_PHARH|nr:Zn(2)-C6 fungal-type DNA-binding domain [Phaffia rhodozyma]